jgi:hypothetical protein
LIGVPFLTRPQHPLGFWRSFGIVAILLVFFVGGLVVSVKIGGGTNLHNLDAFMILLLILVTTILFSTAVGKSKRSAKLIVSWPLLTGLLTVPILFSVFSGGPLELQERQTPLGHIWSGRRPACTGIRETLSHGNGDLSQ